MKRKLRKRFGGMSVISKTVMIFSVICVLPLIIFIFYVYNRLTAEIISGARVSAERDLAYAKNRIEQRIELIERSCEELTSKNNYLLTNFVSQRFDGTGQEIINYRSIIYPLIEQRKRANPDLYSVWLFTGNRSIPNSWKVDAGIAQIELLSLDLSAKPDDKDYWWEKDHENSIPFRPLSESGVGRMYSFNRFLRTARADVSGSLVSYQIKKSDLFAEAAENYDDGSLIYIIDGDGRIVFSADEAEYMLGIDEIYEGQTELAGLLAGNDTDMAESYDYIFGVEQLPTLGCRVMLAEPLTAIRRAMKVTTLETLGILVITGAAMIVMVYFAVRGIMDRVRKLSAAMRQADGGDYSITVDPGAMDEFGLLISSFNRMISKINELINNVYKVQIREKDAQFRALEAQINPHFLYNSLTSMAFVARSNEDMEGYRMALALGKFYRMSLSKKTELITVSEEMEHLDLYLTIQKIRFGDRVNYRLEVDEGFRGCRIIRNVLQPLVENAISHGLEQKTEGGLITVSIGADADAPGRMLIRVEDNGVGMDSVWTQAINSGDFDEKLSGYGLKNVCERLRLYYAGGCGINARSAPGSGTVITLSIPTEEQGREPDGV